MISIMLVDDHAVVRSGLRRLLEQEPGLQVVSETDSGESAYCLYREFMPDVLVMDLSMPGIGGLEALRRINARHQKAKVLIFSMHENAAFASQAISIGALGYIAKSSMADDLIFAIKEVAKGRSYISPVVAEQIAARTAAGEDTLSVRLSAREFEVFRLLTEGKNTEEVAHILNISQKTAANYQTMIKQKLGVNSPIEMVRLAIRHGLIEG